MAATNPVFDQAACDEAAKCNRCGFCQSACPVYRIMGVETAAARGHHAQARAVIEGRIGLTSDMEAPFSECLLCRACTASCFPEIKTDKVVVAARAAYRRHGHAAAWEDFIFRKLLPDPDRLGRYVRGAALGRRVGVIRLAKSLGILGWIGKDLGHAASLVEEIPTRFLRDRLTTIRLAPAKPRYRVAYFVSCGYNFALPSVGLASLRVLVAAGCEVTVPRNVCCGLPAYTYGDIEAARQMAKINIDALTGGDFDALVTDCASCGSFLKEYPSLCDGGTSGKQAAALSAKVQDINEFLISLDLPDQSGYQPSAKVTYHEPCHLSRYQKISAPPRQLLKGIAGLEFRELPEADWCCGGAGSYNLTHYDLSMRILDRKMSHIARTGAEILATSCPACHIQLAHGARRHGLPIQVAHITQVLDKALGAQPT